MLNNEDWENLVVSELPERSVEEWLRLYVLMQMAD